MTSFYKPLQITWICTILLAILSALFAEVYVLRIFSALISGTLSIFYFYGSIFYFLDVSVESFWKKIRSVRRKLLICALYLGIPFSLAALAVLFLVLDFPGGPILYALSILFWGSIYFYLKLKLPIMNNNEEKVIIQFINKNLKFFIIIAIALLILVVLKWPITGLEMKWIDEPIDIRGM